MSWQLLTIDCFLDRLQDMPDIEAVDEIDTRLQRVKDDRKELGQFAGLDEERQVLNLEEDQLRLRRAKLVSRIESRKWSRAIKAVYGEEGLEACLAWMRGDPGDEIKAIALRRSNAGGVDRC